MSLQYLFRCIQPELKILFHEQKSVSVTTTIFIPVTSANCISANFQENLQIVLKQFFDSHPFSEEETGEDSKNELNLKEEINSDHENFDTENNDCEDINNDCEDVNYDFEDMYEPKPKTEDYETKPSVIGFKRDGQVVEKKKSHVIKGEFKCQDCGKVYASYKHFTKHTSQCDGNMPHSAHICQICGLKLATKYNLKGHIENVHGERTFECDQCDYKAANQWSINNHKKNVHGGKVHVCDHCGFSSTHKATLKVHLQTHMKRNFVTCPICGKSVLSLQ